MENFKLQSAKINCKDLGIPTQLMDRVLNSVLDSEMELINNILKQILNKDPGKLDYKYLSRVFHYDNPMNYELYFKGIHVGSVNFNFKYPSELTNPENLLVITFTPTLNK
ncbi:MAG: hypothetical protein A2066_00205 [Bacteroidetes bacterium GWB2_41_8]|nr:MAG: hypothetical protein A2066_00205 [Bacteroidetes bacterium GWB2_41_8]